ncbi:helix-turn-helix domain-containing protein [Bdellovibrio bacteriovorus]|uniref:helix-turn-helix domain-containing protein n=1 Tax=Bdellovibrio bacteriovorus TaxID=959 RepID=UPI0021D13C6C|nr:helix-turn-helix transcriptional regulator [Bdellovibrio bacteriovorus]UXR66118.1 helix-turn-helix domain-containing protein [Bdellovibrio bacteriovorus]
MNTKKRTDALEMMESKWGRLSVAKLLTSWRTTDELSQTQFAKKLGMSVQSLCDLEKGRRIPTPGRAAKIAKKMGYPEMALITLAIRDALYADGFKYNVKLESA